MSKLSEDNHIDNQKPAVGEIVAEIADDNKQLLEVIQKLLEPCDRITYGQKQREAAAQARKVSADSAAASQKVAYETNEDMTKCRYSPVDCPRDTASCRRKSRRDC